MSTITVNGAKSLDDVITALEAELADTLQRAIALQQALSQAYEKRLTVYELEICDERRSLPHDSRV